MAQRTGNAKDHRHLHLVGEREHARTAIKGDRRWRCPECRLFFSVPENVTDPTCRGSYSMPHVEISLEPVFEELA
jgi:hypothetical protein